ncbi:winged helix-turn-helix transcriptional regulator [Halosimplex litoreum]|uniref:Winged helix-turn-helix transcriptional regulator n=1 Tax=Halosimplex litoreum TaxID=1198301 RepID=A0A7U3WBS7_9EURY|nr:winged helix-turn-helix transcriptional regulator [Halosimplex litoreum]
MSDPLRVDILRELATAHRERTVEPVGFADLRKRVGVRDSGRFRYHLNELRDNFVRKDEGGYRLTVTGIETVAAILAGTYTHGGSLGPESIDSDCSECGADAVAVYRDGRCGVTCANDHLLFAWSLPPAAAADATLPEVVSLAELYARQAIERALAGVCPKCSAPVEPRIVTEDDDPGPDGTEPVGPLPGLRVRCETCGGRLVGPVGFCLLVDSAVADFYRRHDRSLDALRVWEPAFVADDDTVSVAERDPLRVAVDVTLDGDRLAVTVDGSGRVSVREE